jgi:hypothetical protein
MFYVYEHIRPDTGAIFYVGKGSGKRAHTRSGRNVYWKRIVKNAGSFSVRIVAENIDEELAFLIEEERIDQLRRLNYSLCNISNGGEGATGYRFSDAQKLKMSLNRKGISKGPMLEETKRKLSEGRRGRKFGFRPDDWKKNISKGLTGRKRSEKECKSISESQKGKIISDEHKKKLSIAFSGERNHMWGNTHDDVAREKIRQSRLNCKKVKCPHCKKVADTANAARWHFDNCKLKEIQNEQT